MTTDTTEAVERHIHCIDPYGMARPASLNDRTKKLLRALAAERDALKLALDLVANEPNKAKIKRLTAENAALRDEVDARIPVNLVESLVKAAEPVLVEGYESELAALRAEVERLRGAVGEIAQKKKTDELETEYDVDIADFEAGYDACIDIARAAKDAKP
jgi:uncharacterized protein YPO0396